MKKLKAFELTLPQAVLRFYVMMGLVLATGFGISVYLAAILGFTLAISAILGVGFTNNQPKKVKQKVKEPTRTVQPRVVALNAG